MPKLSVLVPARNEQYLVPTIHDIFNKCKGSIEVIAILEAWWPDGWAEVAEKYSGKLVTIHHGQPLGMRGSVNQAAAIASGEYLCKVDAHVMLDEGFDLKLLPDCGEKTVLIPRRLRLDAVNWKILEDGRPPVDYEYMAPPTDEKPFQGKVWKERAVERANILVDKTPTFQGSCWMMQKEYFRELELFDDVTYGSFFNEAQEVALKAWLSGGQVLVSKKSAYAHLHKSKEAGRGYSLESGLREQATAGLRKWIDGKGWHKQTLPLSSLSDHFGTMPGW